MIRLVPAISPVTSPELETVATEGVPETHALETAGVAVPDNCVVELVQTSKLPLMAGKAFTVTVAVIIQPLLFV